MSTELLDSVMQKHDFPWWGATVLNQPLTFEFYRQWIADGKHGQMDYLELHLPQKQNPQSLLPQARSSLVVAVNYRPHPAPRADWTIKELPIAAYAQGSDYHSWLKARIDKLILDLKLKYPGEVFLGMTDSYPVLERDLGQRAGLGWFGKNTCLIHPKRGSFFLLGEIFTSLDLTAAPTVQPDHCGTCTRCIDACPTQAITSARTLDARLCISYWTIEAKTVPPEPLREKIGEMFFGCDICQQVCPWNEKIFGRSLRPAPQKSFEQKQILIQELKFILQKSNKQIEKAFQGTPLARVSGRGLKRNAMMVAVHYKVVDLEPEILEAGRIYPELNELSAWAAHRLRSS